MHAGFVVFLAVSAVFFVIRAIPGGPVAAILGGMGTPSTREALREELGLNQPLHVQYQDFLGNLVTGNLGKSLYSREPATDLLIQVAGPTVSIAAISIVIALLIGIPGGIISAVRQNKIEDHATTLFSFLGISMPEFWIAILIVLAFTGQGILPTYGYTPLNEGIVPWFSSIILPGLAAGIPGGGFLLRMTRSSMLEVLNEEYMKTAKAKGIPSPVILVKHGLQNGLIPVVTLFGILVAHFFGGIMAVEIVFGMRGLGRLLIESLNQRDFPVLQAAVLVIATIFVLINLTVDLLYGAINPKVRYSGGEE